MPRRTRLAILAAATLVVAVAGSVLATRSPTPSEPANLTEETEPSASAEGTVHALDRLRGAGVVVDDAEFDALVDAYGIGGAVRVAAWAADPDDDITIESIRTMRDGDGTLESRMGWGQIARELGVHPGLGSIMGGGNGNGNGDDRRGPPVQPDASP